MQMLSRLLCLLLLAFVPATPAFAAVPPGPAKGVVWYWNDRLDCQPGCTTRNLIADATNMQNAGITWALAPFGAGTPLPSLLQLLDIAKAHGISVGLDFVLGGAGWTGGEAKGPEMRRLAAKVDGLRGRVALWEVDTTGHWIHGGPPEVNFYAEGAETWGEMLVAVHRIFKAHDPGTPVLMGAWGAGNELSDFLLGFEKAHGARGTDGFAISFEGPTPEADLKLLAETRALLSRYPDLAGKPLWVTSFGFIADPQSTDRSAPNETVKGAYLAEEYRKLRAAGISTPIFWSALYSHVTGWADDGLLVRDEQGHITYMPAYDAYRALK